MFRRLGQGPATSEGSSRRQFIKRAGLTGALTAAVIGGAEVAGLTPALASSRRSDHPGHRGGSPKVCTGNCTYTYTPRQCNGGKSCPSGQCCFTYQCAGSCGSGHGKMCVTHSCSNFNVCCH